MINILLVPSVNKIGLDFIFMVTDNHLCREKKVKRPKLVLVEHHVLQLATLKMSYT
jgi:hypothetical protein